MTLRSVLFVDPPAFCTTVEGLVAPALRERPVAVAAPGADRATVLALSAEARVAGITRGMPVSRARKLCPDLILRPPNPELYARASRALHEILSRYAPVIEPKGYGHAFLDLTGTGRLFGPAVDVAARIDHEARQRLGLPLAVGVAQNKLVSEAASEVVKEDGRSGGQAVRRSEVLSLLDVPAGNESEFLFPHEVTLLPDLDPRIRARLDDYQLERIGEIQAIDDRDLCAVFGPPGRTLGAHARGIDPRPVLPPAVKAEFRAVHTLGNDSNDLPLLHRVLRHLTERLGARLRARKLVARRLTLHLAYTDYATAKRSVPLPLAALDAELLQAAAQALTLALTRTVALRAIGVTVDRLLEADLQLELWGDLSSRGTPSGAREPEGSLMVRAVPEGIPRACGPRDDDVVLGHARGTRNAERGTSLQSALDRIRTRWGARGIRLGA
jgi:DNA polymerase-4